MPQYLSTDPTAGLTPPSTQKRYLSTDPQAGLIPLSVPKEQSMLGTTLNAMNAPGSALRGGIQSALRGENPLTGVQRGFTVNGPQVSSADILKEQGIGNAGYARDILGFAGDVVLDPLNVVPFGKVAQWARKGADALGITKAARAVGKTAPMQELGRAFIPHFDAPKTLPHSGVGPTYREQKSLLEMRQRGAAAVANTTGQEVVAGIDPALRSHIPTVIEGTYQGNITPELQKAADAVRTHFGDRAKREIDAGVLDPAKLKQDYFTYLFPKGAQGIDTDAVWRRTLSASSRFSKPRNLKEWEDAVARGAETDLAAVLGARGAGGERAATTADWAGEIATKFGVQGSAHTKPLGWKAVTIPGIVETSPLAARFKNTYFPPDIAEDLTRVMNFTPEGLNTFQKTFSAITSTWKTLATAANPGFHLRNMLSNGWLMSASGMSPVEVAGNMKRGAQALTRKSGLDVAGKSHDEVLKLAHEFGIIESGHLQEFADSAGQAPKIGTDYVPGLKQYVGAMQKVGDVAERSARLGMFRHALGKGKTAEEAALQVRKYLFNYHELTDTEKTVRRYAIPFYAWMRKSAPVVAESFIANPKLWSRTDAVTNMFERMAQESGDLIPDKNLAPYERDDIQMPALPGKAQTLMSNPFPVTEIAKWATPVKTLGSSLNPLIKAPIEYMTNKSLFTGAPIAPELVRGVAPSWAGTKAASGAVSQFVGKHALGMGTFKGRQQNNVAVDYVLNQIPFSNRAFSTVSEAVGEPGESAGNRVVNASEKLLGLTRSKSATEVNATRHRAIADRKKEKAQEKSVKRRSKSVSRLDQLAKEVGI